MAPLVSLLVVGAALLGTARATDPVMSDERVVFTTPHGEFEFGFWPEVAPITSQHIFNLVRLGCYITNNIFRVDKGFVAQLSDVTSGRLVPLNDEQRKEAIKTVPLEVRADVKHHEGVVSMARGAERDGAGSSFFIMYGNAPHLDGEYGAFGKVTRGMEVLHHLETLPTKREGIFVMPLERITIQTTYWYRINRPMPVLSLPGKGSCEDDLSTLTMRFESQAEELQRVRKKCLPA